MHVSQVEGYLNVISEITLIYLFMHVQYVYLLFGWICARVSQDTWETLHVCL